MYPKKEADSVKYFRYQIDYLMLIIMYGDEELVYVIGHTQNDSKFKKKVPDSLKLNKINPVTQILSKLI